MGAFRVKCEFIPGSDAQGCMLVLVGELDNTTVKLTRGVYSEEATISTVYPTSCYKRVIAYDIEYDGSVGSLAVPGKLLANTTSNSAAQCLQEQNAPFLSEFWLNFSMELV